MKKSIMLGIIAAVTMAIPVKAETGSIEINKIHSEIAVVTETKENIVSFLAVSNNNLWEYGQNENAYKIGDLVSITLDTNGTETLEDDKILIDPVVCGQVDGEGRKSGLVEYMETAEDDILEWFEFNKCYYRCGMDY